MTLRDDWRKMSTTVQVLAVLAVVLIVSSLTSMVGGAPVLLSTSLNAVGVIVVGVAVFLDSRRRGAGRDG